MTSKQKKLVAAWVGIISFLALASIFDDWTLRHWDTLKWPTYCIAFLIIVLNSNKRSELDGRDEINRIVEENPWIKLYLAIYGLIIAIGVSVIITKDIKINASVFGLLIFILLLFLPIFLIQQREAYIAAGKE